MKRLLSIVGSVFVFGLSVKAGSILAVTTGGTFAGGTPTTSWTQAGETWSVSFDVSSTPTVNSSTSGEFFDVPFTNFVYTFNGVVTSVGTVDIDFFSNTNGGLFALGFFGSSVATLSAPASGISFSDVQAYSGSESAPTILPNLYDEDALTVYADSSSESQSLGTVSISAAPESSTWVLMGAGLLALVSLRRYKRA